MPKTEEQFVESLSAHSPRFDLELSESVVKALVRYFGILQAWNTRLHLVAPCSPEEFAVRHILESLLAIKYIPADGHVIDVGSGGGLPIIPCLIARPDINATLIEASQKKAVFLREALKISGLRNRANVLAERFESMPAPNANVVICRALERFTNQIKTIVKWAPPNSQMILFGGPSLEAELMDVSVKFDAARIPESDQRFIFVVEHSKIADGSTGDNHG